MRILEINILIFVFILLNGFQCLGQPKLKILFTRFGALKKYEFFQNDIMQYKVKGERGYKTDRIIALRDDNIILTRDSVNLKQLKMIRIKSNNYHSRLFQRIFLVGGIGFATVNSFNNAMNHISPLMDEKALMITGSLLAASFIIYESRIKRIRLTENKSVSITNLDFEHLNQK